MTELEQYFINKAVQGVRIIEDANFEYVEYGVFGSFARGDFKGTSDIDFVMIVNEIPDRAKISVVRDKLDRIKCDFAILLKQNFDEPNTAFSKAVKRDYRRLKAHG